MADILRGYARIDAKGCIVIPAKIRRALGLTEGVQFRFEATPESGEILMHQQVSVDKDQAWFWTTDWQEGEREADADIAAGRVTRMKSESILEELGTVKNRVHK